ncbi:MMPL family transporter [Streptomyces sp. HSW2009]|uniref:MMPL family transporter n=1 Tax=Streptomyces sp. HSW2009 TaxID=3142890 RepID=UPI0032EC52F0
MATFLYKLGRFAFRRRRFVALFWVALLAVAVAGSIAAPSPTDDKFTVPGVEAQEAFDLMDKRSPEANADGASARIVFRAPEGTKITDPKNKAEVLKVVTDVRKSSDQLGSIADPFEAGTISKNGEIAFTTANYKVTSIELKDKTKDGLKEAVVDYDDKGGKNPTVEVGGDALEAMPEQGAGEIIGIAISAVVLVITFGSLVAAGLPLLTALIGVGIGITSITALANVLNLGSTTSTLAMMIGLAVGIDYALFIVSRYRAELAEGREREEAAGRAVGTAGSAVVFAGLTVIIALVGLAVVNIPILYKMGFAAAATVAIAVLIAISLIPALLGFAGKRIYGRKARKKSAEGIPAVSEKPKAGTRWAQFVLRRPVAVLLFSVVALGAAAAPVGKLQLGLPDDSSQSTDTTQRRAYDLVTEGFGAGSNGPLMLIVDAADAKDPLGAAQTIAAGVKKLDDVASVSEVSKASLNKAGDTATIMVTPDSKPTSTETEDLVTNIRDQADGWKSETGARVLVTGTTAMNIDVSAKLDDALVPYLGLVVGLAFLLLMIVFRSVLVPLKAALGFLLSVVAALGAVVAVFQLGWFSGLLGVEQTGPVMSIMPIFMIGVVFGLAMDYEVFLVTRMREAYVHGETPAQAVVTGFKHGARVVTAAAVIMISVFAGFIGSHDQMIKMMGFGLAIAVFFDAFVVRMAIVPAVLALLGKSAWWLPAWLDKVLPNVDVEGEKLHKELGDTTPAQPDADPDARLTRV